jgi:hypothetical protein
MASNDVIITEESIGNEVENSGRGLFEVPSRKLNISKVLGFDNAETYCHASRIPWLIITDSGLDEWIYWHFYYNYNQL